MWKLYKQQRVSSSSVEESELILIKKSDRIDELKSEGRKLAIKDGCPLDDQVWVRLEDANYYELSVKDKYKIIIRDW